MTFFFVGGRSGDPSCPATKKLSLAGMVNGLERRMPVSFSPPGERLEINWEVLSPSADSRFSRNHGLVVSLALIGTFLHSRELGSTETNNCSARAAPQSRTAGSSGEPRWAAPS